MSILASAPLRAWQCNFCCRKAEEREVVSSSGCVICGSTNFQILQKGHNGYMLPILKREKSLEASELLETSRIAARQALDAVNGDFNAACRSLLLAPHNPPFANVALSNEIELAEFGGVSREQARDLLTNLLTFDPADRYDVIDAINVCNVCLIRGG